MQFYGRENELSALSHECKALTFGSRLAVVTGRRRVGKTTLLLKAAEESALPVLYFFVQRKYTEQELAQSWIAEIRTLFGLTEEDGPAKNKLSSVIRFVLKLTQTRPSVLIIDECQEIDRVNSAFWSELQEIWDREKKSSHLALWMSGSVASAIRHIFGDTSEPLFGRQDLSLTLRAFEPFLLTQIFTACNKNSSTQDLLMLYAVTGGIARYVETLVDNTDLTKQGMLDYIFSIRGEFLRNDGATVLANEFRVESPIYYRILRALAQGKTRWSELADLCEGKVISPYVERLEKQYDLISRHSPIFSTSTRGLRYRLKDPYFRFWFRFTEPATAQALAERQNWNLLIALFEDSWENFSDLTLEDWFRESYLTSDNWTQADSWWDKKGENEIDLVAVNSHTKTLEIAEVKRNRKKYNPNLLSHKITLFNNACAPLIEGYKIPSPKCLSLDDMLKITKKTGG